MIAFDHVAIAGESLAEATAHVEDALGVSLQSGGEHDVFFTHNTLLGLEDGLYLEAIAINPAAPKPTRARWFDLDNFEGPARLTNWICRSTDLATSLAELPDGMGSPVQLHRGDLRWQMAVPDDGKLPFENLAPALIEWQTQIHPSQLLTSSGVRLQRLTVSHPQAEAMAATFAAPLSDDRIAFETGAPALHAAFETPHGPRAIVG